MSLEAILKHISAESDAEAARLVEEGRKEADGIMGIAREEAEKIYRARIEKEKALCEARKKKRIVSARLEARKKLLETRQELIGGLFGRLEEDLGKKALKIETVGRDKTKEAVAGAGSYIANLRFEHEAEVARILFG